jgi:hypothetical protein
MEVEFIFAMRERINPRVWAEVDRRVTATAVMDQISREGGSGSGRTLAKGTENGAVGKERVARKRCTSKARRLREGLG